MAITLITTGSGTASATTVSCSPGATIPTGSCIVLGLAIKTTTSTVSSVADGGNSYVQQVSVNNGTTIRCEQWAAVNTTVQLTTSSTITVTLAATAKVALVMAAYSGVIATGSSHNSNTTSAANPTLTKALAQWEAWAVTIFAGSGTGTFSSTAGKGTLEVSAVTSGGAAGTNGGAGLVDWPGTGPTTPTLGCTNADTTWAMVSTELDANNVSPYQNTNLDANLNVLLRM